MQHLSTKSAVRAVASFSVIAAAMVLFFMFRTERPPNEKRIATPPPQALVEEQSAVHDDVALVSDAGSRPRAELKRPAPLSVPRTISWGAASGQLGRTYGATPEQNVGPGAIALDPAGGILIIDKVNGRIARWGADGSPRASLAIDPAVDEIVTFRDGRFATRNSARLIFYSVDGSTAAEWSLPSSLDALRQVFAAGDDLIAVASASPPRRDAPNQTSINYWKVGRSDGSAIIPPLKLPGWPLADEPAFVTVSATSKTAYRISVGDGEGGAPRAQYDFVAARTVYPTLIGVLQDQIAYVLINVQGANDPVVECVDLRNGEVQRRIAIPGDPDRSEAPEIGGSPPVVRSDGAIIVSLFQKTGLKLRELR